MTKKLVLILSLVAFMGLFLMADTSEAARKSACRAAPGGGDCFFDDGGGGPVANTQKYTLTASDTGEPIEGVEVCMAMNIVPGTEGAPEPAEEGLQCKTTNSNGDVTFLTDNYLNVDADSWFTKLEFGAFAKTDLVTAGAHSEGVTLNRILP